MMQKVLCLSAFHNTLCCLFCGTSRDREKKLFLMWHCVTVSGISLLIMEKVLQPPGVTYDLHFFFYTSLMPSIWYLTILFGARYFG